MFAAAATAIIIGMALALVRAFAGPTLYDRVLAGNSFGTKTVLLIGVMGFLMGRPDFLDIALVYALINFAGTIAILKFFRYRTLSVKMDGSHNQLSHKPSQRHTGQSTGRSTGQSSKSTSNSTKGGTL